MLGGLWKKTQINSKMIIYLLPFTLALFLGLFFGLVMPDIPKWSFVEAQCHSFNTTKCDNVCARDCKPIVNETDCFSIVDNVSQSCNGGCCDQECLTNYNCYHFCYQDVGFRYDNVTVYGPMVDGTCYYDPANHSSYLVERDYNGVNILVVSVVPLYLNLVAISYPLMSLSHMCLVWVGSVPTMILAFTSLGLRSATLVYAAIGCGFLGVALFRFFRKPVGEKTAVVPTPSVV